MCDILVLSAMSLSEGGFTADGLDVRFTQVDEDSYFVSKVEYDELQQLMRSKELLAAAAKKAADDADAKRKSAEVDAARARSEAEAAKRGEVAARSEAEAAKRNEAHARSAAEVAKAGEARAKAEAEQANAAAAAAKKAAADEESRRQVAEADAVRARSEAETAKRGEVAARNEAEAAKKGEAHARSVAEVAKTGETRAKADAERANGEVAAAKKESADLHKELADMKRRQRMLKGEIPSGFVQKLQFQLSKKKEHITLYSPLLRIGDKCYSMFEIDRLKVDNVSDIENITVEKGFTNSFRSVAFRSRNNSKLFFVQMPNADWNCAIQCGVEIPTLEDNLVFYVETGECHGNPVPCSFDKANESFSCSAKTETRTIAQRIRGEGHSVYEGCFLLSAKSGALLGIVRGDGVFDGVRKCDVIKPMTMLDLVPLADYSKITP